MESCDLGSHECDDSCLRRSPLLPIFLIVAVDVLGLTIMIPLLPFYAEHYGASPAVVGLLISTYAACQLFSGPLLGRASDRIGRRPLLLVSQAGTLGGFLMLALAQSLWMVFLARVIDGFTAGNLSLAQAYISDVSKPEDRAKSFGIIGIAFGMGFMIGPAISGYLSRFGYSTPIFAAAALSATSILATWFLLPAARPGEGARGAGPAGARLALVDWGGYAKYFRDAELGPLMAQYFAFVVSFSLFTSGFPLFAERRYFWEGQPFGPQQVGYFYAYAGFLGIFLQGPMLGQLVRRFGEVDLIRVGFLASTAGYAWLGFAYSLPELLVVTTISAIGGVLRPTVTSLITQSARREEQGVVLGLTQSLSSVAQIVSPTLAGFLIERGWLASWALTAAAITTCGLALALRKAPKNPVAAAANSHRAR